MFIVLCFFQHRNSNYDGDKNDHESNIRHSCTQIMETIVHTLPPPQADATPSLSSTAASSQSSRCTFPSPPNILTGVSSPPCAVGSILTSLFQSGGPPTFLNPSPQSSHISDITGTSSNSLNGQINIIHQCTTHRSLPAKGPLCPGNTASTPLDGEFLKI